MLARTVRPGMPEPTGRSDRARQEADCIGPPDHSWDDHAGVAAPQVQGQADSRVEEPEGFRSEPISEFGAAPVRLRGDLDDSAPNCESASGR